MLTEIRFIIYVYDIDHFVGDTADNNSPITPQLKQSICNKIHLFNIIFVSDAYERRCRAKARKSGFQ